MLNGDFTNDDEATVDLEVYVEAILARVHEVIGDDLATSCVDPLARLGPRYRVVYGELASALLEAGSRQAHVPGVLDIPKSTLTYRIDRVYEIFGNELAKRESRLAIMLALRAVLPRWRAEARYAQSRRGVRTDHGAST